MRKEVQDDNKEKEERKTVRKERRHHYQMRSVPSKQRYGDEAIQSFNIMKRAPDGIVIST